jgi:hypothetical protein
MTSQDAAHVAHERDLLRLERDMLRERLNEAREREATLLRVLEQLPHALERPAAAPPILPQHGPRLASAMRQQILSVLQRHPRGLHRKQIEDALGNPKDLANILGHMKRDRLLVHKGSGIYTLAGVEDPTRA